MKCRNKETNDKSWQSDRRRIKKNPTQRKQKLQEETSDWFIFQHVASVKLTSSSTANEQSMKECSFAFIAIDGHVKPIP